MDVCAIRRRRHLPIRNTRTGNPYGPSTRYETKPADLGLYRTGTACLHHHEDHTRGHGILVQPHQLERNQPEEALHRT